MNAFCTRARPLSLIPHLNQYLSSICSGSSSDIFKQGFCQNMDHSLVEVDGGYIKGETLTNDLNQEPYFSFKGVPYACPPTGALRFQPPKEVEKWEGVLQCTEDGSMCCQKMMIGGNGPDGPTFGGSEDCLYLNVYFPVANATKSLRPVMVFFHGGGFQSGSGDSNFYGPDFLVAKEVVLVAINYRLNVFGFLNLGIESCPGNVGLLDQRAALIWVRKHIQKFSGDPDNVTIFGESAGSASIHYHLLSPLSKGLFDKAVLASGCVLDPWAYMDPQVSIYRGFCLGKKLGCSTTNSKELLEFLISVPASRLVEVVESILTPEDLQSGLPFSFVPSKEIVGAPEDQFLSFDPRTHLNQAPDVPTLVGLNSAEGLIFYLGPKMLSKVLKDPDSLMDKMFPDDLKSLSNDHSKLEAAKSKVRQFYLKGGPLTESDAANTFANFLSDVTFGRGNYQWLNTCLSLPASKPISLYMFDFKSDVSLLKLSPAPVPDYLTGACHADELFFLFNFRFFSSSLFENEACMRVVENMTTIWTNFAKFGNPKGPLKVDWKPITPGHVSFCKIGPELEMQPGFIHEERMKFWSDLRLALSSQSKL